MKQLIRHILREHTSEIGETKKLTNDEFILRAKQKFDDKYDYSKTNYIGTNKKIKVICPIHGEFEKFPADFIKSGCSGCNGRFKSNNEDFISKARLVFGDKYDYSKVNYKTIRDDVKIICPLHGEFLKSPYRHLKGEGCTKCSNKHRYSTLEFIDKAKEIHGDTYEYSKTKYTNTKDDVIITCKKHGDFLQPPKRHLKGEGCPICNESKGEKYIRTLLDKYNIKFLPQKKFNDCFTTSTNGYRKCYELPFDFYLPDYNACIEFDGKGHYEPILAHGGEISFTKGKERDQIKDDYCKKNNIKLIRIPYFMSREDREKFILKELGIK